jgi:hypothetical protein
VNVLENGRFVYNSMSSTTVMDEFIPDGSLEGISWNPEEIEILKEELEVLEEVYYYASNNCP